jgi:hypothetical protein
VTKIWLAARKKAYNAILSSKDISRSHILETVGETIQILAQDFNATHHEYCNELPEPQNFLMNE